MIAVILLLVGVLFIGVNAWRDGANKAACLVNMASIQKAVRGEQNVNLLTAGTSTLASTTLVTDGYFGALPTCPIGEHRVHLSWHDVPAAGHCSTRPARRVRQVLTRLTAAQTANW